MEAGGTNSHTTLQKIKFDAYYLSPSSLFLSLYIYTDAIDLPHTYKYSSSNLYIPNTICFPKADPRMFYPQKQPRTARTQPERVFTANKLQMKARRPIYLWSLKMLHVDTRTLIPHTDCASSSPVGERDKLGDNMRHIITILLFLLLYYYNKGRG